MSADIINLRQARKSRARSEKAEKAQENRLHFGRTKAEKQLTLRNREKDKARLDAHQRETPPAGDPPQDHKER
jgi:hypothetical protein